MTDNTICTGAERLTTHAIERMLERRRMELDSYRNKTAATETAIRNLELELERRQGTLLEPHEGMGGLFT